jgi:hypothetical protein
MLGEEIEDIASSIIDSFTANKAFGPQGKCASLNCRSKKLGMSVKEFLPVPFRTILPFAFPCMECFLKLIGDCGGVIRALPCSRGQDLRNAFHVPIAHKPELLCRIFGRQSIDNAVVRWADKNEIRNIIDLFKRKCGVLTDSKLPCRDDMCYLQYWSTVLESIRIGTIRDYAQACKISVQTFEYNRTDCPAKIGA